MLQYPNTAHIFPVVRPVTVYCKYVLQKAYQRAKIGAYLDAVQPQLTFHLISLKCRRCYSPNKAEAVSSKATSALLLINLILSLLSFLNSTAPEPRSLRFYQAYFTIYVLLLQPQPWLQQRQQRRRQLLRRSLTPFGEPAWAIQILQPNVSF